MSGEGRRNPAVEEVEPAAAAALACGGAVVVDVREPGERALGSIAGSVALPLGSLEAGAAGALPDRERTILLFCESATRSRLAIRALRRLGYADVRHIAGGFQAWVGAGLPVERRSAGLTEEEHRRYARHLAIPEVGAEGQVRLKHARVLVVGAGGLGSPAAVYLASAGVGTLGIVDSDRVDESNLQRQILHTTGRIGQPKTASARRMLEELNPLVRIETFDVRLDATNVEGLLAGFDVIVDGSDNFPTRYLINDACVRLDKPNVHGSVFRFEGQASVFRRGMGPCYRCLFPEPPPPGMVQSCAEAGVLGILPGVIGTIQAVETIKLILGAGEPLYGRLLVYDALAGVFRELAVQPRPACYCAGIKPPTL